jgi:hypothetical protein
MDCETVKVLILEKIFNVFAPKITGYYSVLGEHDTYTWVPNINFLPEHHREHHRDSLSDTIYIRISMDKFGNVVNVHFRKTKQVANNRVRRMRALAVLHAAELEPEPEPEIIELEFKNKQTAVREICKHTDITYLTKIGMSAIKEIKSHENPDNMSIGSIKQILDIKPGVDLNNLETRRVLIEKIK